MCNAKNLFYKFRPSIRPSLRIIIIDHSDDRQEKRITITSFSLSPETVKSFNRRLNIKHSLFVSTCESTVLGMLNQTAQKFMFTLEKNTMGLGGTCPSASRWVRPWCICISKMNIKRSVLLEVRTLQTDRQTDTQTDATENITMSHSRVIITKLEQKLIVSCDNTVTFQWPHHGHTAAWPCWKFATSLTNVVRISWHRLYLGGWMPSISWMQLSNTISP